MRNQVALLRAAMLGVAIAFSSPSHSQMRHSVAIVHPAPKSKTITVAVKELRRIDRGRDEEVLMAQAAGFSNDTCDVITTFDVVKKFEERQTWRNVRQRVDVVVDGKTYPAKFRDFGFYPLGLNLACIDFDSPRLHAHLPVPALPLEDDSTDHSSLTFYDGELAGTDPGTPFLNKRGEIIAVLVATGNGRPEFASADDIRTFLLAASGISILPAPIHYPFSSI